MGLDMYLSAEKYQWGSVDKEPTEMTKAVNTVLDTKGKQVSSVRIWAADWRKANQIHNWFVHNVQDGEDDCKRYRVSIDQLRDLVELCKKVLAFRDQARELLPPEAGFFFGSTEIDEYYYDDLMDTIEKLEPFTIEPSWEKWDFYYQSSW